MGSDRPEMEKSEVAVRHVAVLGAEQKTSHNWKLRVTVHDHCGTSHTTISFKHCT